jgi:histidine triad (HIT) family protein
MSYDDQNIFAKILRGEIPCDKIYEDDFVLVFEDVRPQAPSHALIIPKGKFADINDFSKNASDNEIVGLNRAIATVADQLGISENSGGNGYRLISNAGNDSHQEVPHLHFHLLAGRPLGPMLVSKE